MGKLYLEDVNPEAGSHPVPSDERALTASLAAGRVAGEQWTYLRERFGERGLRFSQSDGAWIAAVAQRTLPEVQKELCWLRTTLSRRGMPHIIIQTFIEEYCRLMADDAVGREPLARLQVVTDEWTGQRHRFLASPFGTTWRAALAPLLGALAPTRAQEAEVLLTAALVDEEAGVRDAYHELATWLGPAWWSEEQGAAWLMQLTRHRRCG